MFFFGIFNTPTKFVGFFGSDTLFFTKMNMMLLLALPSHTYKFKISYYYITFRYIHNNLNIKFIVSFPFKTNKKNYVLIVPLSLLSSVNQAYKIRII